MSKIVTITLGDRPDAPAKEGWMILNYEALEGGRCNIGVRVAARDGVMPTWAAVAAELVSNMNGRSEWPKITKQVLGSGERANQIRVSCPDDLNTVCFVSEFNPKLDQNGPHQRSPSFIVIAEEKF